MSPRLLALFAREPVPGRVKTRLTPPFTAEDAAELYTAMLLDIASQHAGEAGDWDRALWYTPPEAESWFRAALPPGYTLEPQRGADLGARMNALFNHSAQQGYTRVVLRGTDSPTLPPERVPQAFERLETHDAVFCPDLDGGYNLVGLRKPEPALFEIELGVGTVLEQTLSRASSMRLSVALLPEHHDVDTAEDVERLRSEALDTAPRTANWLNLHFSR